MNEGDIDGILNRAGAEGGEPATDEFVRSVLGRIEPSLRPVRPLWPPWMLSCALGLAAIVVALLGAQFCGMYGWEEMGLTERVAVLGGIAAVGAVCCVGLTARMIPGARTLAGPVALPAGAVAIVLTVLALLFRSYAVDDFLENGLICFRAGLSCAVAMGLAAGLVTLRGYAVDPAAAGAAGGALAGLSGVGMLALHCPIFDLPHVATWHVGVMVVGAGVGALSAVACRRLFPV